MYARLVMFSGKPGSRAKAEKLADQAASIYRTLKGFKSAMFITDEAVGEYVALSQWESKEAAEAIREALAPVQHALSDIVTGPPMIRLFEVYEPQG
ncbi:MAG: antibiotic biosynthesis monooxygenase [Chloroflexota bacterium]